MQHSVINYGKHPTVISHGWKAIDKRGGAKRDQPVHVSWFYIETTTFNFLWRIGKREVHFSGLKHHLIELNAIVVRDTDPLMLI